jgi:hypothetical protein
VPDIVLDCPDQVTYAAKCAATNPFARNFREPAFDLIQPGGTGRRKVYVIPRSVCQPAFHLWVLVRSIIVKDQMDFETDGDRGIDAIQKSQKLLVAMSRLAVCDDRSFQDIQSRKQRGRPVPLVIMRLSGWQPRS